MKNFLLSAALLIALLLTGCSYGKSDKVQTEVPSSEPADNSTGLQTQSLETPEPANSPDDTAWSALNGVTVQDAQGMVTLDVTPKNLGSGDENLLFEVVLNTHSVDLNMDLSALSILETDNGLTVSATKWDAPSGGHHVTGSLNFPVTNNGQLLLDGAKKLTLTIKDVDAPLRTFIWQLK